MANAVRMIKRLSRRYNLDPRAVLAVARTEGGLRNRPGDIGDQGTSFGPFQLHRGGALPGGIGNADKWAWSKQGIDYALRKMRESGAGGLHGSDAIQAIVSRFERPADPSSEITKAIGLYGQAADPGGYDAGRGNRPGTSVRTKTFTNKGQVLAQRQEARSAMLSMLLERSHARQLGENPDAMSLMQTMRTYMDAENAPIRTWERKSMKRMPGLAGEPGPGGPSVLGGKIIGTPFTGTHTLGNWESDNAIDVALPVGTPIYAAFNGTVGDSFGPLSATDPRFAGLRMHLVGKNNELYYAHLSKFAPGLHPGQRIRKGQLIGFSGSANGVNHLHLGSKRVDPRSYWRQ